MLPSIQSPKVDLAVGYANRILIRQQEKAPIPCARELGQKPAQPKRLLLQMEISFRVAVAKPMSPKVPKPSKSCVLGSGTLGVPVTFIPEVVPKEKVAEVMVVPAVIPDPVITNIAPPLRNGLCGLFPAMLPLAFE